MTDTKITAKRVIVHIGPHKTGSTAIQKCLTDNRLELERAGISLIHGDDTHKAAIMLLQERFDEAEATLRTVSQQISSTTANTVLLSQEDFCGDLPGRSRRKVVYPRLTKNLRIIARSLKPHHVTFVFFERDIQEWLQSCYHQHLKHRTFFSTFGDFQQHLEEITTWDSKLEKPRETFGESFITSPYSKVPDAGVRKILEIAGNPLLRLAHQPENSNSSPTLEKLRLLERVNALSSFKSTAWFTKTLVMEGWSPKISTDQTAAGHSLSEQPAALALPELVRRAQSRVNRQQIDDILPERDVKLEDYLFDFLPADATLPEVSRIDIRDRSRLLDYHLRGKSQLSKLNALTISYLRRDTDHTEKAKYLFHRIWAECGILLVNELTTRWLISTLQTFLDHGQNEAQRMIGASGYFYANMMKIYEGERAIEGLEQDANYSDLEPQTPNKFSGLDRYSVGGTDLLLNTNALALNLAMRDDVAGLVLQELLLRVKSSANVFTRMDRTRKEREVTVPGFEDTWSFFDEPR